MKVAIIGGVDGSIKCGVMDYTKELTNALREQNIDVTEITHGGNTGKYINISRWTKLSEYISLVKKLKREKYDLLQIEYPAKAYGKSIAINMLPIICRMLRVKCVFTSHEYSDRSFLGKLRQVPSFVFADEIIVVEPKFEKDVKKLPFCKKKVNTVCIGSNIEKSTCSQEKISDIRKKVSPDSRKIMSYFGFINEYKCFTELIDAMHKLKKDNKLKSRLLIIGELKDNDAYHLEIKKRIEKYGLQDNIYITGYLNDEVSDYLRASDFAVLPFAYGVSVRNGSFLAAYQENIDIITTKSKSVFPYNDVYFMDDNSVDSIANSIEYMQDNSVKSGNRVIDYQWESVAKRHIGIYKRI